MPTPLASGTTTPNHHHLHHHLHHHGKRVRQFVRPDGRKVHIAQTPEDHAALHKQLSQTNPEADFDIFIQGTPEHLEAIRELHAHHEAEHITLRETHGTVYERFEHVKSQLDELSNELFLLTKHEVALDANFSKFGYSAHLRTKDDDDDDGASSPGDEKAEQKLQDRSAEAMKFWKRPVIRQYFHKGLLWRSRSAGEAASSELFADLLYVGLVGFIGDTAAESRTGKSIIQFVIQFSLGWRMWLDLTLVVNWFEVNDIAQRISVLLYLALLFGFSLNIAYAFETTYTIMIAFFLAARIYFSLYLGWVAIQLPQIKMTMIMNAIIVSTSSALWIGSIHVDYPNRLALIFPSIAIDHLGTLLVLYLMRQSQRPGHRFHETLARHFDFYPAFNIEHRVERTNGFVTLVFGYSVLTILYQNASHIGVNAFLGKGLLGLIQAFVFNWIYFEIDQYKIHVHAIRRHYTSAALWLASHQPFLMAYVLAAAALSRLVVAHDCSDADPETLGEEYIERSVSEIDMATRWFYCIGLGIALLSICVLSLTHVHKQIPNARLKKRPRLAIRACVAIGIICLPLARSLSSLSLISITTSLVIFILIVDLYGLSCYGEAFWTGGFSKEQKMSNEYSANIKIKKKDRKKIEKAMREGQKMGLEQVMRLQRSGSASTLDTMLEVKDEEWHGGHV